MSYEYYHPDDIQKMVHLHHDGKRSHFHSTFFIPHSHSYSHEASHSHANGAVSLPQQVPEVGVVCDESVLICQSILPASGIRRLHQRHTEVSGCGCGRGLVLVMQSNTINLEILL